MAVNFAKPPDSLRGYAAVRTRGGLPRNDCRDEAPYAEWPRHPNTG